MISDDQVAKTLELIASGHSLRHCARTLGVPVTSLYDVLDRKHPEHYARARESQAELDADNVRDLGDQAARGEIDPQAARVAIDAYKWSAGKRSPRKYGDRLTHANDPEHPMPDPSAAAGAALGKLSDAIDRLASRQPTEK